MQNDKDQRHKFGIGLNQQVYPGGNTTQNSNPVSDPHNNTQKLVQNGYLQALAHQYASNFSNNSNIQDEIQDSTSRLAPNQKNQSEVKSKFNNSNPSINNPFQPSNITHKSLNSPSRRQQQPS